MKKEYDFSKGERGKFYRPGVQLNMPIYLDSDVAKAVRMRAKRTKASMGAVVNEWLREGIRSSRATRRTQAR